ncbi:hypothetical protein VST7929_03088 [Vibrio stylophorae]|uniref:Uncharacterized protein n=2 Tax=Vibrio stylophorae TaxID=659351 RepID=A0ABM8ZYU1_9VIBR|nr:hypothetical protein VST7929_03088 [Vibrio stylophorae]
MFGLLGLQIAADKGYNHKLWALIGALLGPVALILFVLPQKSNVVISHYYGRILPLLLILDLLAIIGLTAMSLGFIGNAEASPFALIANAPMQHWDLMLQVMLIVIAAATLLLSFFLKHHLGQLLLICYGLFFVTTWANFQATDSQSIANWLLTSGIAYFSVFRCVFWPLFGWHRSLRRQHYTPPKRVYSRPAASL